MDNRNDVGFKIAKPFFDVNKAGDTDLILNSSWPTLQIAFETNIGNGSTEDVTHGLDFPPLTMAWLLGQDITRSELALDVDSQKVSGTSGPMHIKCYNVDLSKDVEYPFIQPPEEQTITDKSFGMKLVKEGVEINSEDMRDYIFHSRCQSPLVLAVKTQASASGTTITYKSPYPFLSWVFGFVKSGDQYRAVPYFYQAAQPETVRVDPDTNTYTISWDPSSGQDGATLVVLRDPFFAGTDVRVDF